eukprot:TRINITY_DN2267_c0_g1_i2.p1 TRINITY_DN2267_c0_g1~~TRINITY_DN2267_c0_g1_i2.p1  ORF type:complete len:150 (-),score=20.14 TRINITY_DN2267_c0_g1_i2:107-556(-)
MGNIFRIRMLKSFGRSSFLSKFYKQPDMMGQTVQSFRRFCPQTFVFAQRSRFDVDFNQEKEKKDVEIQATRGWRPFSVHPSLARRGSIQTAVRPAFRNLPPCPQSLTVENGTDLWTNQPVYEMRHKRSEQARRKRAKRKKGSNNSIRWR